jgi:hypothetical protein
LAATIRRRITTILNTSFASSAAFYTARLPAVCCLDRLSSVPISKKTKARLPAIAREIHYQADEISGFGDYRTFVWCVAEILRRSNLGEV